MSLVVDRPLSLAAERIRRRRRRLLTIAAVVASFLAVVAMSVWLFFFTDLLVVKTIRVEGVDRLPAATVEAVVERTRGEPLASLPTHELARSVEEIPAVRGAEVIVRWPTTLVVRVAERQQVGRVVADTGLHSVGPDGTLFTIEGVEPSGPEMRIDPEARDGELVRAAAEVLGSLPPEVLKQVRYLEASSGDAVTFEMSSRRTVVWGNADRSDDKSRVLKVLLRQEARVYDVSAPDLPVTRGETASTASTQTTATATND